MLIVAIIICSSKEQFLWLWYEERIVGSQRWIWDNSWEATAIVRPEMVVVLLGSVAMGMQRSDGV